MVRMAARYGHFTLNELRDVVECISAPIHAASPVFFPVVDEGLSSKRAN